MTHPAPATAPLSPPHRSPWILPAIMIAVSLLALAAAGAWPGWARLFYLVPYTFLGNSLAPLPYDGAVIYLGSHHSLPVIVLVALAATVVIEVWNIELLARVLARDGTRSFRNHRVTQWTLHWYRKAPFWSLVTTCVLPIVPHYPMRFLVVLAGYSTRKYLLSVILGRGARYAALAGIGVVLPIPGEWMVLASLVALAIGYRGARRMNRAPELANGGSPKAALPEEA